MKKILLLLAATMLFAHVSFGANFQPTLLKLSAPNSISYQFDGSTLNIPVTVSGTPAGAIFCVYTQNMAASVKNVKNGFLGWHTVNKVDTSVYIAPVMPLPVGKSTITWNGKDDDRAMVPAGSYTYYLFGYDNVGSKIKVSKFITATAGVGGNIAHIQEIGPDGKTLANPKFYGTGGTIKWTIGNDPDDTTFVETTTYSLGTGYSASRTLSFQSDDFSRFFLHVADPANNVHGIRKMIWVPNGTSTSDVSWGKNGIVTWEGAYSMGNQGGCETIGDYVYTTHILGPGLNIALSDLYKVSVVDGVIEKKFDLTEWWAIPGQVADGGYMVAGPGGIDTRNGFLIFNANGSCIRQMVNPEAEDLADFNVWVNGNGDYVLDKNAEETAGKKWLCNDFNVGPFTYNLSLDSNLFSIAPAYDMGAVSFGLLAPDGDGINYFAYAGETASFKTFNIFVDSGSAFDGIYCDNQSAAKLTPWDVGGSYVPGVYYMAHDSIKGIISNAVAVKEAAPLAFSVNQNAPNPFNPATTISFRLAKAGKVSVEIFNTAGQKVDTVLNASMSAGDHSVTWNASRFSAGMYFYTVKSGDFSRTMKMTLLK